MKNILIYAALFLIFSVNMQASTAAAAADEGEKSPLRGAKQYKAPLPPKEASEAGLPSASSSAAAGAKKTSTKSKAAEPTDEAAEVVRSLSATKPEEDKPASFRLGYLDKRAIAEFLIDDPVRVFVLMDDMRQKSRGVVYDTMVQMHGWEALRKAGCFTVFDFKNKAKDLPKEKEFKFKKRILIANPSREHLRDWAVVRQARAIELSPYDAGDALEELPRFEMLCALKLNSYTIDRRLASVLPKTNITLLDLSKLIAGGDGLIEVLKVLPSTKIRHLDMQGFSSTRQSNAMLAAVLPRTKITHLFIDSTKSSEESSSVVPVIEALRESGVVSFSLSYFILTSEIATALVENLKHSKIETLKLKHSIYKKEDLLGIIEALPDSKVKMLDLSKVDGIDAYFLGDLPPELVEKIGHITIKI